MTSTQHELAATFEGLDLRLKGALADVTSPLTLILAALLIAHDDAGHDYVSLDHLHEAIVAADVAVKRESLSRAIARAGKKVNRKETAGVVRYRLTTPGRRDAEKVLGTGDLELMYLDGNRPRTARRELGAVLGDLKGTVRICDPYYGVRSLETLELIPEKLTVRFLTAGTSEKPARLSGPMKDFKKERPNVEMREAAKPHDMHDRYVLSDGKMMLVGHGLKDIGAKESFVMVIPRTLARDLLDEVVRSFDKKWGTAVPL